MPLWPIPGSATIPFKCVQKRLDGLECFPPSHREEYGTTQFRDFAHLHSLFCSSGSDFHGINNLEVPIGENVFPEEEVDAFLAVLKKHEVL